GAADSDRGGDQAPLYPADNGGRGNAQGVADLGNADRHVGKVREVGRGQFFLQGNAASKVGKQRLTGHAEWVTLPTPQWPLPLPVGRVGRGLPEKLAAARSGFPNYREWIWN